MNVSSIAQLPDTTAQDKLDQILLELRGIRLALAYLATQDGTASPDDFDVTSPMNDAEVTTQLN